MDEGYDPRKQARRNDPSTSHEAARQAESLSRTHCAAILDALNGPMITSELAAAVGLLNHQVNKRLSEMGRRGSIRLTGRVRKNSGNRNEREWERV